MSENKTTGKAFYIEQSTGQEIDVMILWWGPGIIFIDSPQGKQPFSHLMAVCKVLTDNSETRRNQVIMANPETLTFRE